MTKPHGFGDLSRADFLRLIAGSGAALALGAHGGRAAAAEPIGTRPIPASGEPLPVVGVGTWRTFDVGGSDEARAPVREVLRLLFEAGGRIIDSSPMYGRSEGVVGDLLAELGARDSAFLATKVWTTGEAQGKAQMKTSLERFRSDRIELMQIHNLVDWRTHLPVLRDWKAAGTLRYVGITHYTNAALDDLAAVIEAEPIDFVQCAYSVGVRAAERRLLPLAAERGVAVIVNRPYEGGSLFGKAKGGTVPDWAADFEAESWGQIFLKFILAHPAVTCVIPGTGKPHHMRDNLGAGRGPLPDADLRKRIVAWHETA